MQRLRQIFTLLTLFALAAVHFARAENIPWD
jgi:hypothetical protein